MVEIQAEEKKRRGSKEGCENIKFDGVEEATGLGPLAGGCKDRGEGKHGHAQSRNIKKIFKNLYTNK
jgi:hypothetical protein